MPATNTTNRINASSAPHARRGGGDQQHGDDQLGNWQHDPACPGEPFRYAE